MRKSGGRIDFIKKHMWESSIKLNANYRIFRKLRADITKINKEILSLFDKIEKTCVLYLYILC